MAGRLADSPVDRAIFVAIGAKTNGNSAAKLSAFAVGIGSLTLPPGFWLPGMTLQIEGDIQFSTTMVVPQLDVSVESNGAALAATTIGNLLGSASNSPGHFRALLTCRSAGVSGQIMVTGEMNYAIGMNSRGFADLNGLATVDTTVAQTIDVLTRWSSANAANTLIVQNAFVKRAG